MCWRRVLGCLVPCALLALLGRCCQTVLEAPNFDWAGARLMPLLTLRDQGQLYTAPTSGPVYNTIYSPLSYLAYLPTLICREPVYLIATAAALGLLFYFGPVLGFTLSRAPRRAGYAGALAVFFLFGVFTFQARSLRMSLEGTIHDCPTLGLAALACLVAYHDRTARRLALSALFAILAVWSKQIMVPLLVALPLWTTLAHGRAAGLRHLGWIGLGGVLSLGLFMLLPERQTLWFNVITLPRQHPWVDTFPRNLAVVTFHLYEEIWLALLIVAVLLYLERPWQNPSRQRWCLFVVVALLQLPSAFLARVKVGGSSNSFSPLLYFLLLALAAYVLEFLGDPARPEQLRRGCGVALTGAVGALFLLQSFQSANFLKSYPGVGRSKEHQVHMYIRAHPGEAYFPWNPLPHYAAEGRTCHFAYGLFDRELGGFAISDEHLNQHRPPHCRYVCFPPGRRQQRAPQCLERLLREYPQRVEIDELPGFECYERSPP